MTSRVDMLGQRHEPAVDPNRKITEAELEGWVDLPCPVATAVGTCDDLRLHHVGEHRLGDDPLAAQRRVEVLEEEARSVIPRRLKMFFFA